MAQGSLQHEELSRLAGLLAEAHRRYLEERGRRERAERALAAERTRAEEAERRAGAIINEWLHAAGSRSRHKRRSFRPSK
jgi:hypothetical protein